MREVKNRVVSTTLLILQWQAWQMLKSISYITGAFTLALTGKNVRAVFYAAQKTSVRNSA